MSEDQAEHPPDLGNGEPARQSDRRHSPAGPEPAGAASRGYYGLPILKTPVWRWEVWLYFFCGGLAAGSFVVASLAALFGDARDRAVARVGYLVSFSVALLCPLLLIKDLGRPTRFLNMLRVFKLSSPMSLGVWALLAFSACATLSAAREVLGLERPSTVPGRQPAEARRSLDVARRLSSVTRGTVAVLTGTRTSDRHASAFLALVGTPLACFVGSYTGVLLSTTSVPLWSRGRTLGATFLASAFSSGISAISLLLSLRADTPVSSLTKLERVKRVALIAEGLALARYLRQADFAARPLIDDRQLGRQFLGGTIGLGLVAPAALAVVGGGKSRPLAALGSLCGLAGALLLRYSIVEGGRISAEDPLVYLWDTDKPEQ